MLLLTLPARAFQQPVPRGCWRMLPQTSCRKSQGQRHALAKDRGTSRALKLLSSNLLSARSYL